MKMGIVIEGSRGPDELADEVGRCLAIAFSPTRLCKLLVGVEQYRTMH